MKNTRKKYLMILFLTLSMALLPIGGVKAALQANPNTHEKKTEQDFRKWMSNIRKMEETNGAMGLSESLNSDLTSKESNNIDVHMMKTTEYGAIAILSASGYGNPQTLQNSSIKTTTGNKTGVYFSGKNSEVNAGGEQDSIFEGVSTKYYDEYTGNVSSAKVGDALECRAWHSATVGKWVDGFYGAYFMRDFSGLFSSDRAKENYNSCLARGVAVCGTGL